MQKSKKFISLYIITAIVIISILFLLLLHWIYESQNYIKITYGIYNYTKVYLNTMIAFFLGMGFFSFWAYEIIFNEMKGRQRLFKIATYFSILLFIIFIIFSIGII